MSGPSSINNIIRQIPTADTVKAEHQITLVDHEREAEPAAEPQERQDAEVSDSEASTAPDLPTPGTPGQIKKKLTRHSSQLKGSLQRRWTGRKYAKYGRDRYNVDEDAPPDEDSANQPQIGQPATEAQTSYLERQRAKARQILKRKRTVGRKDAKDTVMEILYENQRGIFFFGIPKYSSSSLLPSDPKPWQNAQLRTSPVDIRTAQVPDPSWEWAWKNWYVDMSRDVDEEGWEYSFQFAGNFAWHGNHPWFHSFVRRRRWLRMRRKRDVHRQTKEKAHELTGDYFTIHPRTLRAPSEDFSRAPSSEMLNEKLDEDSDLDKIEITDIGSLILILKKAAVDREKLVAVRKFIETGGDELVYLADRMPEIMNLLIFQSSRRQILTDLLKRSKGLQDRQESLVEHKHEDRDAQKEHDATRTQAENLMQAVKAADEQVKKLEYWSDIKSMAQKGHTLQDTSHGQWDLSKWQGLSPVGEEHSEVPFASKQKAEEGVQELHRHPEHGGGGESESTQGLEGSKKKWYDAKENRREVSEDSKPELEKFVTPAQSTSDLLGTKRKGSKGKGRARNLDGLVEDDEDDAAENEKSEKLSDENAAIPDTPRSPQKQSVQIVEPIAESEPAESANALHKDS